MMQNFCLMQRIMQRFEVEMGLDVNKMCNATPGQFMQPVIHRARNFTALFGTGKIQVGINQESFIQNFVFKLFLKLK